MENQTTQRVKFEKQEGIGLITINRPEVMNAIDDATAAELQQVFGEAVVDPSVKVIIFTGAGEKAFVAGSDLKKIQEASMVDVLNRDLRKLWTEIEQSPKPTIAAVNGYCIGGGLELALSCDIRLANTKAKFAITDVKLGFLPGAGAIHRLPKLIGKGKAKEMILTGDPIDANEAHRVGLVNHVTEPEELMNLAQKFAKKFMTRAPLALRLGKVSVDVGFESGVTVGSHFENIAQALLCSTEDKAEGIAAFFEKRSPEFKGE